MSVSPVALTLLALEISPLRELQGWVVVGSLLESFVDAARGSGSLSHSEAARLRGWAGRWRQLSPALRRFYGAEVDDAAKMGQEPSRAVQGALWAILRGQGGSGVSGAIYGLLRRSYEDRYGHYPPIELVPKTRSPG